MEDGIDKENMDLREMKSKYKYMIYITIVAVLVANIGSDVSTWFTVQLVAGLISGVVLVGTVSYFFEQTTFGQLAEEMFQRHRLLSSLLIVVLITVSGFILSSILESQPRAFLLTLVLGMVVGMFILNEIADYNQ